MDLGIERAICDCPLNLKRNEVTTYRPIQVVQDVDGVLMQTCVPLCGFCALLRGLLCCTLTRSLGTFGA
jgi:hypothetical protein